MKTNETRAKVLREMSVDELQAQYNDAALSLFKLRVQAQTERLDAPSELRKYRRLIARIKTIQTERAPKEAPVAPAAPAPAAVAPAEKAPAVKAPAKSAKKTGK